MVLEYALKRNPTLADKIKTIHRSPAFGIPPVVVPPNISPKLKVRLQTILLDMPNSSAGRQVLAALGFDRFTNVPDTAYDSAREIIYATEVGVK